MVPATATPTRREHVQALLLAALCAVLFLRGALAPDRALVPFPPELFDVQMAEAVADGTFDPAEARRGNAGMGDKYLQSLCWDRVMADRFAAGELPRWTRDIGGGAPFVPQMAQPYEPVNLLLLLLPSVGWYGWWFLLHQVLFGWFAYGFLRRLGCRHASALVGLVAAALGLWTQGKVHHNVILTAAVALWPMLSAVHDLVAGGRRGRAALAPIGWLALWTGVSWNSGFVVVGLQASYLTVLFALFLAWRAPRGERLRRLLPVGAGFALGGLLAVPNMVPILLASAASARAGNFDPARLAAHGLEWDHLLTLGWPDLLSWAGDTFHAPAAAAPFAHVVRMPWSQLVLLEAPLSPVNGSAFQSWVETTFAIGIAPLALACLAWSDRERRAVAWLFGAVAFVGFGIATADEPFLSLARAVPGLGDFDQRRALFLVAMALVVLAALGSEALLAGARRRPAFALLGAVAVVSLAALVWLGAHGEETEFVRAFAGLYAADADHPDVMRHGADVERITQLTLATQLPGEATANRDHLATTALRSLLVAVLFGSALAVRRRRVGVAAAIALAIAELLHTGLGPVQTVPAARVTNAPAVLAPVLAAPAPNGVRPRLMRLVVADQARIDAALPGNFPAFLGIEDAGAYNPLPPARYEQFFRAIEPDRDGKASVAYGGAGVGSFHDPSSLRHPLADLYGIRFVVTRDDVELHAGLVDRTPPGTGGFRLLERTTTLPRATFVRTVDVLPDRDDRLRELARPDRDVAGRVVLEDPTAPLPTGGEFAPAAVEVAAHGDERVVVRVRSDGDGYLRLADPYDAGWRAHVDGEPKPLYVADHYLRAVFVPAGEHEVVFTYEAPRVVWPARIGLAALLGCVALLALGRRRA